VHIVGVPQRGRGQSSRPSTSNTVCDFVDEMMRAERRVSLEFEHAGVQPLARQCSRHARERLAVVKCAADGCRNYCPTNRRSTNGHATDQPPTLRSGRR
jgi:hypothetical protein